MEVQLLLGLGRGWERGCLISAAWARTIGFPAAWMALSATRAWESCGLFWWPQWRRRGALLPGISGLPASAAPCLGYEATRKPRGVITLSFLGSHSPYKVCLLTTFQSRLMFVHPGILAVLSERNRQNCVHALLSKNRKSAWFLWRCWHYVVIPF